MNEQNTTQKYCDFLKDLNLFKIFMVGVKIFTHLGFSFKILMIIPANTDVYATSSGPPIFVQTSWTSIERPEDVMDKDVLKGRKSGN